MIYDKRQNADRRFVLSKKRKENIIMARFFVRQEADYVVGHLRYGHRERYIEADSIEDARRKVEEEGYDKCLNLVVDDYEVDDVEYGDNEFEIEEA